MIEFGEKLKSAREEKGMTQQTLADNLYVTRQAVSRWECGARYPDLLTAKKIAEVLDTTIDELVSGEECKRDVEKEPVLATPKYRIAQIVLYVIGMMPYLMMTLFSISTFFPSESLKATPAGQITVITLVAVFDYVVKMIVMGSGLYLALRNRLTPFRIGIVMSLPFLMEAIEVCVQVVNTLIKKNGTVGFSDAYDIIWRLIVAGCILFFFSKKGIESRLRNLLLSIFIYGVALYKLLFIAQMFRHLLLYYTELGYVVRTVRGVGELAFVILLVFQTYVLNKKRRMVE